MTNWSKQGESNAALLPHTDWFSQWSKQIMCIGCLWMVLALCVFANLLTAAVCLPLRERFMRLGKANKQKPRPYYPWLSTRVSNDKQRSNVFPRLLCCMPLQKPLVKWDRNFPLREQNKQTALWFTCVLTLFHFKKLTSQHGSAVCFGFLADWSHLMLMLLCSSDSSLMEKLTHTATNTDWHTFNAQPGKKQKYKGFKKAGLITASQCGWLIDASSESGRLSQGAAAGAVGLLIT